MPIIITRVYGTLYFSSTYVHTFVGCIRTLVAYGGQVPHCECWTEMGLDEQMGRELTKVLNSILD